MRNILIEAITIDNFIKYQNGSLVSIFRPSEIRVTNEQMEKIRKNVEVVMEANQSRCDI